MILFDLKNTEQLPDRPGFSTAAEFLRSCTADHPDGIVELDGKNVYAIIESYETKPESGEPRFEAHHKYIDIQLLLSGQELIGWAPAESIAVTDEYNAEKDILFGSVPPEKRAFTYFGAGQAMVLFPSDGHAPGLAKDLPHKVKKVVVKIRVTGA